MTQALEKYQEEIKRGLVAQAASVRIVTDQDYQEVAAVARRIQGVLAELEEARTHITKPMNEALRNTNALFKSVREQYEMTERILKDKLAAHLIEAQAAESDALKNTENHDALGLVAMAAPVAQGVSLRTYFDYEIVNIEMVPDTFWVIDEKALRAYIKATKGRVAIPGVNIVEKKDVAVSKG